MRSLFALFLYTVVIPGCGTTSAAKYNGPTYIDPDLRVLVADWARSCRKHIDPVKCDTAGIDQIVFADRLGTEDTIGTCSITIRGFEETRRIHIRRDVPLDGYTAKALILHEMMHCKLGFERHEDVGVMGAYMIHTEEYLEDNWAEILKETYSLVK